jgi:hypothetical protein
MRAESWWQNFAVISPSWKTPYPSRFSLAAAHVPASSLPSTLRQLPVLDFIRPHSAIVDYVQYSIITRPLAPTAHVF